MNLKMLLIAGATCAMATTAFAQGMGGNLDANSDGKVDKTEYSSRSQATIERLDTDKDGKVSTAELAAMAGGGGGGGGGGGARMLGDADADKDGFITLAEVKASRDVRFDQLDTNKDGSLSAEEQQAGRTPRPAQ